MDGVKRDQVVGGGKGTRNRVKQSTCEHHEMLEVVADLVLTPEVEQEGQGVDVGCPPQEYCYLEGRTKGCNRCREVWRVRGWGGIPGGLGGREVYLMS